MTLQEANKIIAEYMGFEYDAENDRVTMFHANCGWQDFKPCSESLDALVPVWEKLKIERIDLYPIIGGVWVNFNKHEAQASTIQQAAAIATVKAIKELEK